MGGGAMTLGRSSGGQKRVGMRSMSRLVLLARRESQDPEVDVPPTGANPRGAIRSEHCRREVAVPCLLTDRFWCVGLLPQFTGFQSRNCALLSLVNNLSCFALPKA